MEKIILKKLILIFKKYPAIKLVYFFGSKANGQDGPLADYDFAVYFEEKHKRKMFDFRFMLIDEISRLLNTDKIDIVILNLAESPELKYQIIKYGKLIYEQEPYQLTIEPRILNEYFDFQMLLERYNLTKIKK